jgi:hypothetical protein
MGRTRVICSLASLAGLAGVLACGPSYQAIYEGDARFEHCYALEDGSQANMTEKAACWRAWIRHYTYGQTRDRVEYATSRYRALTRAPEAPTDEAMMEAAPGAGRESTIAAPAPTSAFAPPPKTLSESAPAGSGDLPTGYADAGGGDVTEESTPKAPGAECTAGCEAAWSKCRDCDGGAKCAACGATYKKCMRTCFAK